MLNIQGIVINILVIVGAVLLILGRKLYWLLIGAMGFMIGFSIANQFIRDETSLISIGIAIVVGVIFAILVYYLQRFAIILVGLVGGGYLVSISINSLSLNTGQYYWLFVLGGAIIGAVLFSYIFDWMLIILSSIMGAVLIVKYLPIPFEPQWMVLVFIILLFLGVWIQSSMMPRKK